MTTPEDDGLTPWQRYKKNLGNTRPWDLLKTDEPRATDEEAAKRLDICKSCAHYLKPTHQCKKCGCLMNLKVKLAYASCPVHKWDATDKLEVPNGN